MLGSAQSAIPLALLPIMHEVSSQICQICHLNQGQAVQLRVSDTRSVLEIVSGFRLQDKGESSLDL